MVKVLIADDHLIVREGLKQILGPETDVVVAGEAKNGLEALCSYAVCFRFRLMRKT